MHPCTSTTMSNLTVAGVGRAVRAMFPLNGRQVWAETLCAAGLRGTETDAQAVRDVARALRGCTDPRLRAYAETLASQVSATRTTAAPH
jgi:hypothetical protein